MKKTINSSDLSEVTKLTKTFPRPHQYYIITKTGWKFNVKTGFSTIRKVKNERD